MSAIKSTGVLLIVVSFAMAGFFKSRSIKARAKKLSALCDGLDLLFEYIEQSGSTLEVALGVAFSKCDFLEFQKTAALCHDNDLTADDKAAITDFFASLGHSAKKAECDRIQSFKSVMTRRARVALEEAPQKCKLWQTMGICTGLVIGILLI